MQQELRGINAPVSARRDPMGDDVVRNLMAGYELVDLLVATGTDLFAMGNSKYLLELNNVVLCGPGWGRSEEYARPRQTTEQRFYDEQQGGVQDLVEWYARHVNESTWNRAAGVYVRLLSKPQLYIEGNHRTGALVMSYILLRDGQPPFVLTTDNAATYFDPSATIRNTHKQGVAMLWRAPGIKRRLARMLAQHADRRYLRLAPSAAGLERPSGAER